MAIYSARVSEANDTAQPQHREQLRLRRSQTNTLNHTLTASLAPVYAAACAPPTPLAFHWKSTAQRSTAQHSAALSPISLTLSAFACAVSGSVPIPPIACGGGIAGVQIERGIVLVKVHFVFRPLIPLLSNILKDSVNVNVRAR